MITAQPLFIPLYIDEAEADLWLALQRIEPEKRSSFIIETLRQALLGTDRGDLPEIQNDGNHANGEAQCGAQAEADEAPEDPVKQIEMFSLEDLFSQPDIPYANEKSMLVPEYEAELPIRNRPPGFDYLMKHIIGTEDDQAVLRVLNRRAGSAGQNEDQKPGRSGY
ncbi:hypothetical protein [Desulfosporosinus youngiae]|uniref:Uncharacterized protein n=1 Tax=Desulfosporosinus youngiae DSM 17734 TaxID=768710 RepID=H5Y2X1_9FIRM|nr:hypothetical protein [Desulfosporosinus youngiae]EHQ88528.1 hypothetical protein DesyoDRAFT_1370 [Desulfosporosinus youngiae DSM 17734]